MRLSLVDLLVVDDTFLGASGNAGSKGLLVTGIGFTSHGGLVGRQLVSGDAEAIDRDVHAVLEVNDVTNLQVVDMQFDVLGLARLAGSGHSHLNTNSNQVVSFRFISNICNVHHCGLG